ncbi:hypothetical protein [Hyphobacterium sp. CCMP332]
MGLIRQLFPASPVIHIRRRPVKRRSRSSGAISPPVALCP